MWIRSQNKRAYVEFKNGIYTENFANNFAIYCNDLHIGNYSTKEKAIKVIDIVVKCDKTRDFEMPSDEEVEV